MEYNFSVGLVQSLLAGCFLGTFAWPMKLKTNWRWEKTWLVFSTWALVVFPWIWASWTVPNLFEVLANVEFGVILSVFFFGVGWGIASVSFGIGLASIGIALGTAIVLGLNNAIGAILPLVIYSPQDLLSPSGIRIIVSVGIMIIGIILCSIAGARKERILSKSNTNERGSFKKGLILCLISGTLGAMFNFALIAGKPLEIQAKMQGASLLNAVNPTWCVSLMGGFIVTLFFCGFLLFKNRKLERTDSLRKRLPWIGSLIMGVMYFGGIAIYGTAVMNLGKLGPSIGWPLIQGMAVTSGSVVGIVSGEWKGTGRKPISIMMFGLLCLVAGMIIISTIDS